ncbi:hypothetical protein BGZ80_005756 [Entomortierella chlamydospora]|uniref:Beta-lactamase/transpeptidase-like protein n=1 Tax=Entomortierella chlamydospora TaxID=101097 RepID=A0A9P6MZB3_9FUNG|nr:hypothetical protein BGZ79_004686 [Entomortierella chlamydospora]KAG0019487.1 hypothetical protein BGZ80_005756 [Entomortierella chlamydospora]
MQIFFSRIFSQRRHVHSLLKPSLEKAPEGLREALERGRIQCGIPGMSVAVLHKGELIFADGFGKRNEQEPFTAETLSPIASLTKAFTATAVGELVAEGKMDWDKTPVNKYLPEFELEDPVLTSQLTMVDLLSHRTGLPSAVGLSWFRSKETRLNLIKRLKHVKMDTKLGSKCLYNNVMYAVAGEAAARVAGTSYEKLVETKILKPLRLSNTGFSPMEMKRRPNHAMPYSAESLEDAQKGLFRMDALNEVYMADAPAGDMFSNVLDLVRWGKAIMNTGNIDGEQVLSKESIVETLSPHTIMGGGPGGSADFGPIMTYGMGWVQDCFKGQNFYWHNGGLLGFQSRLDVFPDRDLVIAQLCNIFTSQMAACASRYIAEKVLNLPTTRDWISDVAVNSTKDFYDSLESSAKGNFPERIPNKPAVHELHAYEGVYSNAIYGDVSVKVDKEKSAKGSLHFKMGALESKLEHFHFDAYVVKLDEIKVSDLATFLTGGDGKVMGFRLFEEDFKRKDDPISESKESK